MLLVERYRLYIDESGDHVFHDKVAMEEASHRYLALVGCWFKTKPDYLDFHKAIEDFKQRYLPHNPDEPIILHRKEIINFSGPFWRLRDDVKREAFDRDLLITIESSEFKLVVVVIDKLEFKLRYPDPFHPYHTALGFMLQWFCGYLNHVNRQGDVMAESRGGREDSLLKNAYDHIYVHGDMHNRATFFQRVLTSKQLKLKKKSANIAGLQLADLLAYPARQDVLVEHERIADPGDIFGTRLIQAVRMKYNRHLYEGRIEGYGKVLFPK